MRIEFGAYQVWPHPDHTILAGRVHEADILLGDVFTVLAWTPWLPEPVNGSRVGKPTIVRAVALRVEGIEAYQRPLEFLSSGMSGALKLTGAGRELLRAVDPTARDGAWLLAGERHAEPGRCEILTISNIGYQKEETCRHLRCGSEFSTTTGVLDNEGIEAHRIRSPRSVRIGDPSASRGRDRRHCTAVGSPTGKSEA